MPIQTEANTDVDPISTELRQTLPNDLLPLLNARDGAAKLLARLPTTFTPAQIGDAESNAARVWELAGLFFLNRGRTLEALSIFAALYNQMLLAQEKLGRRLHKGMPLVWMSDCYKNLGCQVLPKRYLMMTLCEDAIASAGSVHPENTGSYFRLVWLYGLSDPAFRKYAKGFNRLFLKNPEKGIYPEWLLQETDQEWVTELPSAAEIPIYRANTLYFRHLMAGLGDRTGKTLERLADYTLSCMPGCKTARRKRSGSTDYDIICSMEGADLDFRSELGRYFVCECKDWKTPADFTTFAKFCRVLDSTKSRFGILFSKSGLSGHRRTKDAEREQLKIFQDRGIVIVVIDEKDLTYVADGGNFISLLRSKYERVRLDLIES